MLLLALASCLRVPAVPPAKLPEPPPPVAASVCWVEFSRGEGAAAFTTRGKTERRRFDGTVSGLLIRHPQGDVVVDVGNSPNFLEDLDGYGLWTKTLIKQLPGRMKPVATHAEAFQKVGADPAALKYIVGSHAHLDHLGGVGQVPGIPVVVAEAEIPFVDALALDHTLDLLPSQARALQGRMQGAVFSGPPVGPFPSSFDLFGDGSLVLVPMPGHTPGSVGTLVRVAGVPPILHAGDVVMITEGFERPAPKGMIVKTLDQDFEATALQIGNLHALHEAEPELVILPAHDRTAWAGLFGDTPRCLP